MRGIATVIFVGFVSILLFGVVGPAIVEPVVDVFLADSAVQDGPVDADRFASGLLSSLFVWAPLLVLGSGVVSAVVWYFRKERTARRVR